MTADSKAVIGFDAVDRLIAWRTENGETLWANEDYQHRQLSAPMLAGSSLVFGDLEGYIHFLARDTGKAQLQLPTGGSAIAAGLVQSGNTLLAVARNGGLYAMRLE